MAPSPPRPDPDPAPRKRKITARVTENTDPLLPKNKRAKAAAEGRTKAKQDSKAVKPATSKANASKAGNTARLSRHHSSVEPDEDAGLHPKDADRVVEQAVVAVIDVDGDPSYPTETSDAEPDPEAAEESCEAELGKKHFTKYFSKLTYP
jgi:hypothetical protein